MAYDLKNDLFVCKNGRKLKATNSKLRKSKTGYESEKTIYVCDDCSN